MLQGKQRIDLSDGRAQLWLKYRRGRENRRAGFEMSQMTQAESISTIGFWHCDRDGLRTWAHAFVNPVDVESLD
jgi:hypothetical protein